MPATVHSASVPELVEGRSFDSFVAANSGPILLVDDLADSRWTLTVAARHLRRTGVSGVLPFAVALRG